MREFVTILYVLALALGLGVFSANWVTLNFDGMDRLAFGPWVAHPLSGTPDADPYARARTARTGRLALGAGEGTVFWAEMDSAGEPLSGQCDYRINGRMPQARLWTLRLTDPAGQPLPAVNGIADEGLHSRALLHQQDGTFVVTLSASIAPGNWLRLDHDGPVALAASLYDTPVNSATALTNVMMPTIERLGCRSS